MSEMIRAFALPNPECSNQNGFGETREQWLAWRKNGIGASEIAGILGLSPWQTPMSIYLNKLDLVADTPENEAMFWGNVLEPIIADIYQGNTGHHITARGLRCWDATNPHRRCTLDGILMVEDELVASVQIKTTRHDPWDELPDNYALQVQYELAITGFSWAIVPTLHHGNQLVTYRVEADPEVQRMILEASDRFWADHIAPRRPPATDHLDATTDALRAAFPTDEGDLLPVAGESGLADLLAAYVEAQQRTAEAEAVEKQLANELRARLENHEGLAHPETGEALVTYRTQSSRRLDQKRLKADHPDLAEQYSTETTSRVLRITKTGLTYHQERQQ